jgi:hypothetical protein
MIFSKIGNSYMSIKTLSLLMPRVALLLSCFALLPQVAQAQVGAQSLKHLNEMKGHLALQRLMVLPPAPGSQPAPQALQFVRSGAVFSDSMNEAARLMANGGVSVGMAGRLTGSGYFTNAARKYAASVGLKSSETNLAHAVAANLAICAVAQKNADTAPAKAAQYAQAVQDRLAPHGSLAQMSAADKQAMADAVNVQTGLVFWVIDARRRNSGNNSELAYYCGQSMKRLGVDLDKW